MNFILISQKIKMFTSRFTKTLTSSLPSTLSQNLLKRFYTTVSVTNLEQLKSVMKEVGKNYDPSKVDISLKMMSGGLFGSNIVVSLRPDPLYSSRTIMSIKQIIVYYYQNTQIIVDSRPTAEQLHRLSLILSEKDVSVDKDSHVCVSE